MTQLRIVGGTVYDPANDIDGDVQDICIDAGRVVESRPCRILCVLHCVFSPFV